MVIVATILILTRVVACPNWTSLRRKPQFIAPKIQQICRRCDIRHDQWQQTTILEDWLYAYGYAQIAIRRNANAKSHKNARKPVARPVFGGSAAFLRICCVGLRSRFTLRASWLARPKKCKSNPVASPIEIKLLGCRKYSRILENIFFVGRIASAAM